MEIPIYLAMTAAEFRHTQPNRPIAWMSCLFSPYGTGLTNLPESLPPESFLILSDRTPVYVHNPDIVAATLNEVANRLCCKGILLDFQNPPQPQSMDIVAAVVSQCGYPVGIPPTYAKDFTCPVFLAPGPLLQPIVEYIAPWSRREVWLEVSKQQQSYALTAQGCVPLEHIQQMPLPHTDTALACQYGLQSQSDRVAFTLRRAPDTLRQLPDQVTRLFGLYQELG